MEYRGRLKDKNNGPKLEVMETWPLSFSSTREIYNSYYGNYYILKLMNIGRNLYGRTYDWSWSSTYYHGNSKHEKVTERDSPCGLFLLSGRNTPLATETCPFMSKITFRKGIIKMLEMIVFAVVLVIAQVVGGLIVANVMMKKFMNKEFIKKYTKMGVEIGQEIAEEMEDYL